MSVYAPAQYVLVGVCWPGSGETRRTLAAPDQEERISGLRARFRGSHGSGHCCARWWSGSLRVLRSPANIYFGGVALLMIVLAIQSFEKSGTLRARALTPPLDH